MKNIDNVVPDRLKQETYVYKKALGGYFIELQKDIFGYLEGLSTRDVEDQRIEEAFEFILPELSIIPPEGVEQSSKEDKIQKMLEMQKKFIELEQKGEITAESYFVPKEGSDLDGYKEEYSKLAMEVVEEAHKDKGSHA